MGLGVLGGGLFADLMVEGQEDASEASQQTGSPWLQPKGAQGQLGLTQPGESPKEWGRGLMGAWPHTCPPFP